MQIYFSETVYEDGSLNYTKDTRKLKTTWSMLEVSLLQQTLFDELCSFLEEQSV
jgi:hypothetical protein